MKVELKTTNSQLLTDAKPVLPVAPGGRGAGGGHPDGIDSIEAIHIRAETITPLLKSILDFHPTTHWEN